LEAIERNWKLLPVSQKLQTLIITFLQLEKVFDWINKMFLKKVKEIKKFYSKRVIVGMSGKIQYSLNKRWSG
jgi:hypothetical protein